MRLAAVALALLVLLAAPAAAQARDRAVLVADVEGTIDPAASRWVAEAIDLAAARDARLLVLRLDTTRGLDRPMREIVRSVLSSPVPVVVWIGPEGASAASSGLFVALAGHVSAMAPGARLGPATRAVLQEGTAEDAEVLGRVVDRDAAGYAQALAAGRGRNAALAVRSVRDERGVPAATAAAGGLVDVVAGDLGALLRAVDGRRVRGPSPEPVVRTAGVPVERLETPALVRIQHVLLDPSVAFLLLVAGLAGLALEALAPGRVLPGLLGAVALLLGLFATIQLPVNLGGAVLLLAAIALLAARLVAARSIVVGLAGAVALGAAGLLLFEGGMGALQVSPAAAAAAGALAAGAVLALRASGGRTLHEDHAAPAP
jgi:membrane-bound serine protease (ClpP class)